MFIKFDDSYITEDIFTGATYTGKTAYELPDTSKVRKKSFYKGATTTLVALALPLAFTVPSIASPTFGYGYVESETHVVLHEKASIESIRGYLYAEDHVCGINDYFSRYPISQIFISSMRRILDSVYGTKGTSKKLNLLNDPDTNQPILQLVFESGYPIDDQFIEKDRELSEKIEQARLTKGLEYVVFSNS